VGGATWLGAWLALNVGLTLLNKAVFSFGAFNFPLTLSALHMLITGVLSWICVHHLKLFPYNPNIDRRGQIYLFLFSFIFSIKYTIRPASLFPFWACCGVWARLSRYGCCAGRGGFGKRALAACLADSRDGRPWHRSIVMGNVSIQIVSVALVQVFRAVIPGVRPPARYTRTTRTRHDTQSIRHTHTHAHTPPGKCLCVVTNK
jgi:hypothetical protein